MFDLEECDWWQLDSEREEWEADEEAQAEFQAWLDRVNKLLRECDE